MKVVTSEVLADMKGLLVLTYVSNDVAIRNQLAQIGISNVIHVYDFFYVQDRVEIEIIAR